MRIRAPTRPGLDNNAYTNVMAVWVLERALDVLDILPPSAVGELLEQTRLGPTRAGALARHQPQHVACPSTATGSSASSSGYEELEEFDWDGYRRRYGNITRLDRILEAEGDTPNRYKLSKQADVLMLFYLLSREELDAYFRPARLPLRSRRDPEEHRLLPASEPRTARP